MDASTLIASLLAAAACALCALEIWLLSIWVPWRKHMGPEARLGPARFAQMMAYESWAMTTLGAYHVIGWNRKGWRGDPQNGGVPVLCVHGITQNGSNFYALRRELEALGRPSLAVDLGFLRGDLENYTPPLIAALENLDHHTGPVDVVCHSMGGVILRLAFRERPDLAAQVRNIICLGSPHEGTRAAPGLAGRLPPRLLPEVHALSVGSSSLIALPGLETLAPESRRLYITAGWDMLVYPRENACESSGRHEPFEALGHCGLLTDRRVRDLVLKQLAIESHPRTV